MSANPALGPSDLERILFSTAVDLGAVAYDSANNLATRSVAIKVQNTKDTIAPVPMITNPINGGKVQWYRQCGSGSVARIY